MGRSSRSLLQGKIVAIFAADDPRGDCEELEGFFSSGFSHHVADLASPHPFTIIPTASGVASAAAAGPRIGAARGAASHDQKGVDRGGTSTYTDTLRKTRARLRTQGYCRPL